MLEINDKNYIYLYDNIFAQKLDFNFKWYYIKNNTIIGISNQLLDPIPFNELIIDENFIKINDEVTLQRTDKTGNYLWYALRNNQIIDYNIFRHDLKERIRQSFA